ncbi:hypothetical protein MNBD_NITROSPINAE03-1682 [hydrothermal vent metagenome]|uniref:Uncharacterized protein n=1 Tax=hydrothermal vent metagenome TaxID=652676 RepID=A0A3B1CI13_9ZZZZ
MSLQPKLKSEEFFERIANLSQEDRNNVFKINALRKDAEALVKNDPFSAYMLLGMLSGIEAKMNEVRDYFNRVIKISPNSYIGYYNFAIALHSNGFHSEASTHAIKANELNPGDTKILDLLVNNYLASGRYRDANDWLQKWDRVMPKKPHKETNILRQIYPFISEQKIADDDVERLQKLAYSLLLENNVSITEKRMMILEDEESRWLNYMIGIDEPVTEIVDLNEKLAERMADEDLPASLTSNVVIMFSSAS